MAAHLFCHHCGTKFESLDWPRKCVNTECGREQYDSPLVVGVGIVRVNNDKLLGVTRGIKGFGYGKNALPGGFAEKGESIEENAAREIHEETGIEIDPSLFRLFFSAPTPTGAILAFCIADITLTEEYVVANTKPDHETLAVVLLERGAELAFPLHEEAAEAFWRALDAA
jgi:ADP-ribose pyrophosphatase YjhB (NUDIX family)